MAYTTLTADQYRDRLTTLPVGLREGIDQLHMPDADGAGAITYHDGNASTPPPEGCRYVIIDGDLTIIGRLNLFAQVAEGEDGGTVLIVAGNLRCNDLIQTDGGVILVGGDLVVSRVFEASLGDCLCTVLGSVRVRFYHGLDVWIEFGTACQIEVGWGYGLPIGYTNAAAQAVYPKRQGQAIYDHFDISAGESWERTDAFVTMMMAD